MKTKNYFINLFTVLLILPALTFAQGVAINTDNSEADPSAMLDIKSSEKGLLVPRMTQPEIQAIANPANGLLVFSTSDDKLYTFLSSVSEWKELAFGSGIITPPFSCGNSFTDTRDGKSYTTVQIGTQCWMAENLNIGVIVNGSSNQTNNSTIEKYCYDNNTANCDEYGGLYQWDEMMDYITTEGTQGICPVGWHLPTDAEWCTLENYVDVGTVDCNATGLRGTDAGGNLKETGTAHWFTPNTGATNSSGFTALASGYRDMDGSFYWLDYNAYYWASTENAANALRHSLGYSSTQVIRSDDAKATGLNVRCIKN